jgi:hypothetical protein
MYGRGPPMPNQKQIIFLQGTLRGEGRERECRIRATRTSRYADEAAHPVVSGYSRIEIVDSDDFPVGDYEVTTFDGQTEKLTRRADGKYYGR